MRLHCGNGICNRIGEYASDSEVQKGSKVCSVGHRVTP